MKKVRLFVTKQDVKRIRLLVTIVFFLLFGWILDLLFCESPFLAVKPRFWTSLLPFCWLFFVIISTVFATITWWVMEALEERKT